MIGTARRGGPLIKQLLSSQEGALSRLEQAVEKVSERCGRQPPFSPEKYAEALGNITVRRTNLGSLAGVTIPLHGSYIVKVNSTHSLMRQNFTLAHELGHIILMESAGTVQRPVATRGSAKPDRRELERLCDGIAAELLMPEEVFRGCLVRYGVSMQFAELLADTFQTSQQATVIRMAEVSEAPCVAVQWKLAERRGQPTLPCAVWSTRCRDPMSKRWLMVRRGSFVTKDSLVSQAFKSRTVTTGVEPLLVGTGLWTVFVESKGFGRDADKYVLSLIFPQRRTAR